MNKPRGASVIASTPVYIATMMKEDYKNIFKGSFQEHNHKIDIFRKHFDQNTSKYSLSQFCYNFTEVKYNPG